MENYYQELQNKSLTDIIKLVNHPNKLTLEAKLAIQKLIEDKYDFNSFNKNQITGLESSIKKDFFDINSLKTLNKLGIELNSNNENKTIRKSKTAKRRDTYGILIGSFLFLFFVISLFTWSDIFQTKLEMSKIVPSTIMSAIGLLGLVLITISIYRIMLFKDFAIKKTSENLTLNYRPDFKLVQQNFQTNSKLSIQKNDELTTLNISDEVSTKTILNFKDLGLTAHETLKTMTTVFNN